MLEIRRDRVLQDAFDQLWRREVRELLRPFKVKLGEDLGEEGVDLGGVQQEFFRLAIAEALDPKYGMSISLESSSIIVSSRHSCSISHTHTHIVSLYYHDIIPFFLHMPRFSFSSLLNKSLLLPSLTY